MTPAAAQAARRWYERNTELAKARSRASKLANPEKAVANAVRYRQKNRIALNLRARLVAASKTHGIRIDRHLAVRYLGCSLDEFRLYIEARWAPGMSWQNWSRKGWHLDHIRPLMAFDLTKDEDLRAACHFTNMQPLWFHENLKKRKADLKLRRMPSLLQQQRTERDQRIVEYFTRVRDIAETAETFGVSKGRVHKLRLKAGIPAPSLPPKTHCKHGHPFDEKNTHITRAGMRQCRKCHSIREAGYKRARRLSKMPEARR